MTIRVRSAFATPTGFVAATPSVRIAGALREGSGRQRTAPLVTPPLQGAAGSGAQPPWPVQSAV